MQIGNYPATELHDLLTKFSISSAQVKNGIDPLREKELKAQMEEDNPLFKDFAERFLTHYVRARLAPKTIVDYERHIIKVFIPEWKKRKLADIDRKTIIRLIEKLARDAPIQANRKLSTIKKLFNYAVDVGALNVSPATGIKPPGKEKIKDRVLTLDELATVFKHLAEQSNRDTADILRLIALTAQRPGEVAEMRISQLKDEVDGTWWTKSGADTKNKEAHRIYLNEPALAIVQSRIRDYGLSNYVFPARKKDGSTSHMRKDVTVSRTRKVMPLFEAEGIERFTAHDLRRTAATGIAILGFGGVVPDILNHKPQGITRQVYDKYSRSPEIKRALVSWGEAVERAINGTQANIIEINS